MINIIESFCLGKSPDAAKNEDRLVVTNDFLAVIDGSTSKSGKTINGVTGGVFAAEFAVGFIRNLPADIKPHDAIESLSARLRSATAATGLFADNEELPTIVIAIYSRKRSQIWRVGDIGILLDGVAVPNEKEVDHLTASARAMAIELALRGGIEEADIAKNDIGRAFILPLLERQHFFANQPGRFGYGVINGNPVPHEFIEVTDVADVTEIVMASDGYPELLPALAVSEEKLAYILTHDPLLYKLHRSTKGVQPGNLSFDDRTYVRFTR